MSFLQAVHDILAKGALEKGWGGVNCWNSIPIATHLMESVGWVLLTFAFVQVTQFGKWYSDLTARISRELKAYYKAHPHTSVMRWLEIAVGILHVSMFFQIIYFKFNNSAIAYLLQPCHQILLWQGIALLDNGVLGVIISLFILPSLTGTTLAMMFPETGGLEQYLELEAYWLQHFLIESVPLWLLLRNNAFALQFFSFKTVFAGLWFLVLYHFVLLEVKKIQISFFSLLNIIFSLFFQFRLLTYTS
jgi:hypothetical protein